MNQVIKEIEEEVKDLDKIVFDKDVEITSVKDIIENAVVKGKPTYYKEDGEDQCGEWKNRSLTDLYLLAISYFPETTLHDLLYAISDFDNVFGMRCCDIGRYVFYRDSIDEECFDEENVTMLEYKWSDQATEFGPDIMEIADYLDI